VPEAGSIAAFLTLTALGGVAGVVNILAGGGGLVAMPALVLLAGLGDTTANGTFRVAVLAQTSVAVFRFWRAGRLDFREVGRLAVPTLIGASLGALQAATLGDGGTRRLLIGATLAATTLLLVGERVSKGQARDAGPRWLAVGLVVAGWYGGLIQAGVGFLLLLVLRRLGGMELGRANALKVALVLAYTPAALGIFAGEARVDPLAGAGLAVGMGAGAWFGAGLSLGPAAATRIRWAVAVMVVVAALRLAYG
jgi:uncharacterized membrane protein YfcA